MSVGAIILGLCLKAVVAQVLVKQRNFQNYRILLKYYIYRFVVLHVAFSTNMMYRNQLGDAELFEQTIFLKFNVFSHLRRGFGLF